MPDLQIDDKVKKLAKLREISMRKLCQRIEMTENGLAAAFKNNTLKVETLVKISQVLGVPVSYFFDETSSNINLVSHGIGHNQGTNTTQNIGTTRECIECFERNKGLEKEVELLREIINMYKGGKLK